MKTYTIHSFLCLLIISTGCKVIQTAPEGGSIVSRTGLHDCAKGQTCIVDVESGAEFGDTFTAVPEPGYKFVGWKKGLCGGSTEPCALENVPGNITNMDAVTYLAPMFEQADGLVWGSGNWGDTNWSL